MNKIFIQITILIFFFFTVGINAQTSFGPQQVIMSSPTSGANSVFACDIDGDGDNDIISASFDDNKIAWYENTDGNGSFDFQYVVTTLAEHARSVFACDIDGDGDNDIISASSGDDKIAWYENTDGNGNFGSQQIITTSANNAHSVYACDIDGDGDNDVLSASWGDNKIAWYENTDGNGIFGSQQVITDSAIGASSVYSCDIDGDGDNDVLSASAGDNKIAWYENNGNGSFGSIQIITTSAMDANSVYACDLDGDGDNDVLSASSWDNEIAWYENTDGNGNFGSQQVITNSAIGASSVYSCDIDGDGDNDVLSASFSDNKIAWYENTDGNGNFGSQQVITTFATGAVSVYACDIDGNGDNDVLSASWGDYKIAWYENIDGSGDFGEQQIIEILYGACSIFAIDIDNDGDNDVLYASPDYELIAWNENTDGNGSFGSTQFISTLYSGIKSVYACDIDGDNDIDILSASSGYFSRIAWYENVDSNGNFGSQQVISTSVDDASSVYSIDIDGDGDIDVLSASFGDDKIAWYENLTPINIKDLQQFEISIYPNPTNGKINFDFGDTNIQFIKISDITGKTIIEKANIQENETIDLSSFANGIYIISIQTDSEILTTKVVKE